MNAPYNLDFINQQNQTIGYRQPMLNNTGIGLNAPVVPMGTDFNFMQGMGTQPGLTQQLSTEGFRLPNQQSNGYDLNFGRGTDPSGSNLGWNTGTLNLGLAGLNTLGGLYFGNKQLGLANKQFEETSRMNNANLAAQKFAFADAYQNKLQESKRLGGMSQEEFDTKLANMKRTFG